MFLELGLWVAVIVVAVVSAYDGLTGGGIRGSQQDYMWGYVALSLVFYPILTAILVASFHAYLRGAELRLVTVALPAFLVAVLLHIGSWGVSASRWLINIQPGIGASLWTFVLGVVPITLVICTIFALKLRRAMRQDHPSIQQVTTQIDESVRKPHMTWFAILTIVFVILFAITAAGSYLTAIDVGGHWFGMEMTMLTHYIVLYSYLFLTIALLYAFLIRRGQKSIRSIILGPLLMGAIITITSLFSIFSPDFMDTDFRLNTGVVLFVAYSSSLLPSYVIVCILRMLSNAKDGLTQRNMAIENPGS